MHLRGPAEGREGPIDHTVESVERYVDAAAAAGVDEIGFTEHVYYFREFDGLIEHPYQRGKIGHDLARYCDAVVEAKRRGLPVLLGLEVDWLPGREERVREILEPYPWDFLLGSVHIVDGDAVDMDPGLWTAMSVEDVWRRYFESLVDLAGAGLVDVLAHVDLAKILGHYPAPESVERLHDAAVEAIAAAGAAVEISTAGLRKPVGELYPAPSLLAALNERGVPVTLASDAHVDHDVGRDFDRAIGAAREAGYGEVTTFRARRQHREPLG